MEARARLLAPRLGLFSLIFPLVFGCASNSDAIEKKLSSLRDEIQKLQNENDRVGERLEAIELRQARAEAKSAETKVATEDPAVVTRPRLKVLHLAPGDAVEEDGAAPTPSGTPAADAAPRMLLKGQGKDLELRQGG